MKYYKHIQTGEVFAYDTEQARQKWGVSELVVMTPAEIDVHLNPPVDPGTSADAVRSKRDVLLSGCDWVVVRAQELAQPVPQEWLNYRQQLRDVPQQTGFPLAIEWPTEPESPV